MQLFQLIHDHFLGTSIYHFKSNVDLEKVYDNIDVITKELGIDYEPDLGEEISIQPITEKQLPMIDLASGSN